MEFEKTYKRKRLIVAILFIYTLLLAVLLIEGVTQRNPKMIVEFGEEVSRDLSDYMGCVDFMRSLAKLDLSCVDENSPGTYQAVVTYFWHRFTYEIIIKDTTGPKIVMPQSTFYLEQGKTYEAEDFVSEVWDAAGAVELTILGSEDDKSSGKHQKTICFNELKSNSFVLVATDIYGNVSDKKVSVYVDTPPVITGVKDCYVALGTEPDFCNDIFVSDKVDGDVTGNVIVDVTKLNCQKEGDYEISYYVEDAFGLADEEACVVHIIPDEEIARLINSGKISSKEYFIVRTEDDFAVQEQVDSVKSSLVKINMVMETNYFTGNGFIVDITDEFVYIGTNRHVLNHEGNKELYFCDGAKYEFEVVCLDENVDMGIIKVPVKEISKETMSMLQPVKFDSRAFARIDNERVPLFFCLMGKSGPEYKRIGYDLGYKSDYKKVKVPVLWVSMRLEPGNSGTAIFDYDGNIIAVATSQSWYANGDVHYYAVGAKHMADLYKRATGNEIAAK